MKTVFLSGLIMSCSLLVLSCDLIESNTGSSDSYQQAGKLNSASGSSLEKQERFSLADGSPLICPDEIQRIMGGRWDSYDWWDKPEVNKALQQLKDLSYQLEEHLEENPDDAVAKYKLGTFWGMIGDWQTSREYLESSIIIDQTNAAALFNLGVAYWHFELYDEAEPIFEFMQDDIPEYTNYPPRLYYLMGCHANAGRHNDALKAGETYIKLSKGDPYGIREIFPMHEQLQELLKGIKAFAATE